ncbi:hypothetical protein [Pseudoalteromonas sp. T1lg75]|uniref:hypothetical protein n=1 Tax=Pseudoalteromonas sp. T1lg75 TaxID=2077102 RepID=UPI000CF6C831|nr:hypothetical protein [Pseudoalteromonas sp. T1lg75]
MKKTLFGTLLIAATIALYCLYPEHQMPDPQVKTAIGSPSETPKGKPLAPTKTMVPAEPSTTLPDNKVEAVSAQYSAPEYLPPIAKNNTQTPGYQGDLDDHQAYQQYQGAQQLALKRAYVNAAQDKVAGLKSLLARGEREGISAEQLEFARNKIDALEQMQQQLEAELATAR